jgi:hypothetical protein
MSSERFTTIVGDVAEMTSASKQQRLFPAHFLDSRHYQDAVRFVETRAVEFIDENGGGSGVRLRKQQNQKD